MSQAEIRPFAAVSMESGPGRGRLAWVIAAVLLLAAVATRLPAFALSVVDWDESLYFIMAEQWRAGHLPYTTVWDNKPIGIYAIFALFQSLLGDTVVAMRVAAVLAITATSFFCYRITRHLLRHLSPLSAELAGALAGLLFVITTIPDDGIASNTETFMEVFTCLGMLLALTPAGPIGARRAVAVGLSLGLAFIVKYVAVFDMVAVFLAMIALPGRTRPGWARLSDVVRLGLLFSLGVLAPFLLTVLLYAWHGVLPDFIQASLLSNVRRVAIPVSGDGFLNAFGKQAALYPVLYVAIAWVAARMMRVQSSARPELAFVLAWVATSSLGVASGGLYFSHYFLQLLPVLCIATGIMVAQIATSLGGFPRALLLALLLVEMAPPVRAASADLGRMIHIARLPPVPGFAPLRDTPARVAADIRPELAKAPGETIYVFDGEPILYSLLQAPLPTRYVFPSFLLSRLLAHTVDIDPLAQLGIIMAEKPLFVIRRTNPDDQNAATRNLAVYARMQADLDADYEIWRVYDTMVVYRRRS